MNIFITGGNGFIGSHLKEYLHYKYTFCHVFAPSSQELNLSNEFDVEKYIKQNKIDIIVHLANKGGGRDTVDMKNVTEYNLRIFFNIIKHERNVQKIISFGSGAEYGKHKPIIEVVEEQYLDEFPLDEYGFYKSITSRHIEKCNNIVQLRLFGVYGEYENYLYKFISNAVVKNLMRLPIAIHQNVFFDYIYIKDLLKMIEYFLFNEAKSKIYNASRGEKIDLVSLANIINEISEYKSEIMILNDGLNNEYTSNSQKILKELKKFEFTPHKEAISNLYVYFKNNLNNLDVKTIKNDCYLKNIYQMWKTR